MTFMKGTIEKRLSDLEQQAKPRVISSLTDLVLWIAKGGDEEVELSPGMQKLLESMGETKRE